MSSVSPGIVVYYSLPKLGPPSRALPNLENLETVSLDVEGAEGEHFLCRRRSLVSPGPRASSFRGQMSFGVITVITVTVNRRVGQVEHICNLSTVEVEMKFDISQET